MELVWRETLEDGNVAVSNYSKDLGERDTDDLKNWKADFEKITQTNINIYVDYPTSHYPPRFHVYHDSLDMYLQVKKYDEARQLYLLKPKLKDD